MKPAVLMMFRDEADILRKCLEHWYALGVRDFYLCDNGSVDKSATFARYWAQLYGRSKVNCHLIQDPATDWPGRRVINDLKNRALDDGCDWLFPADADEFLFLPPPNKTIQEWLGQKPAHKSWGELKYTNHLPDGRSYIQEPQKKCFGLLTRDMMISMGNHLIEGVAPLIETGAYYDHYSLRTYPQFRRKMENYMTAFHQTQFQDHPHAVDYHQWQKEGEAFLKRRWRELTEEEIPAPKWL